ncbi:hypothetical protein ACWC5I_02955 [Kitasatospora sp. NPDC001574]
MEIAGATLVVSALSAGLAYGATLLIPDAPPETRGLVFFLLFVVGLMTGISASEPVIRRSAERRARRRGEL